MVTELSKKDLRDTLEELNRRVDEAIDTRTEFLDEHMHRFADFQIGEVVVDVTSGNRYVVAEYYRYHAGRNPTHDTSFSVDCKLKRMEQEKTTHKDESLPWGFWVEYGDWETPEECLERKGGFTTNTSRYGGMHPFVTLEEYEKRYEGGRSEYQWKVEAFARSR